MGDALPVAASVAGLLSIALQSTEYLYKYYTACQDQDQDLARTADQLGGLLQSLLNIDEIVRLRRWQSNEQTVLQSIERSITLCKEVIHELQDEVRKLKKEPTDDWKKKVVLVGRRAAYPFRRSTLEKLGEDVDNFRDNLLITLQVLQLKEHQNTQNDMEAVNSIVKNIQAQNLSAGVRHWLRAPDASIDLNVTSAKRHVGTGQWLIQGPAFTAWLQQDHSFLWLYGFAGCGKSVLCSTAIQYTFRHQRASASTAVAFFFFTFNDDSKQDASAVLRALLLQLCGQIGGLEADLTRLKESCNQGTPPVVVLMDCLRQAVIRCRHVYILLDALDESPIETSRADVLSMIKTMRQWQFPGLHLLVTSRDIPDIRDHLQGAKVSQVVEHVALKNDSIQQDILQYVSYQVDHDPQLRRWGECRERIKSYLAQHAAGVFRWVDCQLRPLRQCARSEKHLDKCLRTLPQSLDETYERMLCNIGDESREEAQQILSLLCFSSRLLSVNEVIEAIAVDLDDLECYDSGKRFAGGEDLLRLCPGLIEINHNPRTDHGSASEDEADEDEEDVSAQVVYIAHFSVQEYLLSDRISRTRSRAADFALSGPVQHGRISKTCLLYLTNDDFVKQTLTRGLVQQYALARYAAQYWHYHYQRADNGLIQQLSDRIFALLTTKQTFKRWIRLYNPDQPWNTTVNYHDSAQSYPSPTYYAALLGVDDVLVGILSNSKTDINTQGGFYGNALQAASERGYEKVVQMLLDKGAEVNAQGGDYDTALQAASVGGHAKVVQILLNRGADVHGQGRFYGNALQAASEAGHDQVVQILLSQGAEVNAQGGHYGNALQAASYRGHAQVVQILLDKSADVNAQEGDFGNALQAASARGHEKVVQMLLDQGAEVNAQGGYYGNALRAASERGHEKAVQMLLDKGAEVNTQGGHYGNALQAASGRGHGKVVQMLLDHGADVKTQGGHHGTALQAAAAYGYERIVKILLDHGAEVNAQGGHHGTALHAASHRRHKNVVQMLLDKGARNSRPSKQLHQVECDRPL